MRSTTAVNRKERQRALDVHSSGFIVSSTAGTKSEEAAAHPTQTLLGNQPIAMRMEVEWLRMPDWFASMTGLILPSAQAQHREIPKPHRRRISSVGSGKCIKGGARMGQAVYINDAQLAERYTVNRSTIWRWAQQGLLSKPIRLWPAVTRWRKDEIEAREAGVRPEGESEMMKRKFLR